MEIKTLSKWFVITGTLIIWSIKSGIRPYYEFHQPISFFLGIAPNLLGSFLIPFGACWFFSGKNFFVARIFRIDSLNSLKLVCYLGFGMLVVNEYLQLIPFFSRTFDYWDIVFSAFGLSGSYFIYGKIYTRSLYRFYPD